MKLSFTEPDKWARIHELRNNPPPLEPGPAMEEWIHAQHVVTPYERQVESALDKVMRHHVGTNECWLGISGPSHVGKSSAVTNVLLNRAMTDPGGWRTRTSSGYLQTPYVYVEAGTRNEARGLLASVADVCGIPSSGSERNLHQSLAAVLPALGVKVAVVDEAHMYRRSNENTSRITDGLRNVLHLPVPFVFVGVDLERSALLRYTSRNNDTALQMERRHIGVRLVPLEREAKLHLGRVIMQFSQRMAEIKCLDLGGLSGGVLGHVSKACGGRPGSVLGALKRAIVEAIALNDGTLTEDLLAAEVPAIGRLDDHERS